MKDFIKNRLKEELLKENTILITPEYYYGLEEWYTTIFQCPKCNTKSPIGGSKFCRGCGKSIMFSKTVLDYLKK